MTEQAKDLSERATGIIGMIFSLIGIFVAGLGLWAVIQAWTWELPNVILMLLAIPLLLTAMGIVVFYLVVSLSMIIKGT